MLATSRHIKTTEQDLHENLTTDLPLDEEVTTKFWKSSRFGSESRTFFLQNFTTVVRAILHMGANVLPDVRLMVTTLRNQLPWWSSAFSKCSC